MHYAAQNGSIEIVKMLLSKGANINHSTNLFLEVKF